MKKCIIIPIIIAACLAVCFSWVFIFAVNVNRGEYVPKNGNGIFASTEQKVISPSGDYILSLENYDDNGVKSFKIVVESREGKFISAGCFRARDSLAVLWDEEIDRVWAYSGDLGTFFWNMEDGRLISHSYASFENLEVPQALKELKPNIFGSANNF